MTFEERQRARQQVREAHFAKLRAQGYKLIHCVAVRDARDGTSLTMTWSGETERFLLVNPLPNYLDYFSMVLLGPESRLEPIDPRDRSVKDGPVLTVFKGRVPT